MENQVLMSAFAESTMHVLIFGVLIGALFSIAILAIFDAIKLMRANCAAKCAESTCTMEKPAPKAVVKPVAKPAAKAVAKVAAKPAAKKAAPKKKK